MSLFSLLNRNKSRNAETAPASCTVTTEMIGRSNAWKTAMRLAISKELVNSHLPSGLFFSGGDPTQVAKMLREEEEVMEDLQEHEIPTSIVETPIEYELCEGDEPRVLWRTHEVIGQVLTHTTPDSPPEQKKVYRAYVDRLAAADSLAIVMPAPPPDPTPADQERFVRDLKITASYTREALKHRTSPHPCAVAIVLSKTDTLYDSTDAARFELTDEVLKDALKPLVSTVVTSQKVAEAVIVPISAFGWQRAVRSDNVARGNDVGWLLREDCSLSPYNVDTLMIWLLMTGLLHQEVETTNAAEPALARVYRMLKEDLQRDDAWIVPVKGGLLKS